MKTKYSFLPTLLFIFGIFPTSVFAQNATILRGLVLDDSTGAPLPGTAIILEGTKRGTAADSAGRYMLPRIPPGKHALIVSFIGYRRQRVEIKIEPNKFYDLTIRLKRKALIAPEVVVTAARDRYEQQSLNAQPSVIEVSRRQITRIPTVGEPDLFRALQILPGVTTLNQASNQLYIRGGSPDQNLVRVDGVRILNPFHLFGLAANINPDLVERVVVSTGGFSARYGDAISGVVDIETSQPVEKFDATGNISLLSSKLLLQSRSTENFGWLVSGRRSYHDWAASLFKKELPYHFYDLFGKINWEPTTQNSFRFSAFYSADVLRVEREEPIGLVPCEGFSFTPVGEAKEVIEAGFPWSNLALNFRWDFEPSDRVQTRLDVNIARTENTGFDKHEIREIKLQEGYSFEELKRCNPIFHERDFDWEVDNNLTAAAATIAAYWQPTKNLNMHAGLEAARLEFDYHWENFDTEDGNIIVFYDLAPANFNFKQRQHRTSTFLEAIWHPSPVLNIQPSLRIDWRSPDNARSISPRLSASYALNGNLKLKAALGHYSQGITYLREQGLFGVQELFFPMPFATSAVHSIAGLEFDLAPATRATFETYYKSFRSQAIATSSKPEMAKARGWAYGLEFSLRHKRLQLIYVFAKVKRDFEQASYYTPWDIRHRLQLIDEIDLGKSWTFSLYWALQTGQPYTPRHTFENSVVLASNPRTGEPVYFTRQKSISFPNGSVRYPIYHRLDVTFSKELGRDGFSMAPYFQIINLYDRRNPLFFESGLEFRQNFDSEAVPVLKPKGVPILPTFGLRFAF
ncbi:MAG: TonB-dependent receptor domain-containing protein [bacterium]